MYNVYLCRPLQEDPALGGPFNRLVLQATDIAALAWLEEEGEEEVNNRDIHSDPMHTTNTTWQDNQTQSMLHGQNSDSTVLSPLTESPRPREDVITTNTITTTDHTPLYPAPYTHPTHTEHTLSTEEVLIRREEQRALRDLYDGHRDVTDSTGNNSNLGIGLSPRVTPGTCKRKLSFTSGYPTPSTSSSPYTLTESGAQLAAQRVRRSVVISSFPKYTPQLLSMSPYIYGSSSGSSSGVYNSNDVMLQDFDDEEGQGEDCKANGV